MSYDVVIVGAGVVGLFTAYELAHSEARVLVIDREEEPGFGVSKGHAGVIHVVQPPFNSMRSRLAVDGNRLYDELATKLKFTLIRTGALLVARSPLQLLAVPVVWLALAAIYGRRGFKVSMLGPRGLRREEPNVNGLAAVKVDGYGIVNSFELVSQLYHFCRLNGVEFSLGTEVRGVKPMGDYIAVETDKGVFRSRFLINAAGLWSAELAGITGDGGRMEFGKGAMLVFWGRQTKNIIAPLQLRPNPRTKGGAIVPTALGTTIWGPNLSPGGRDDASVTEEDARALLGKFGPLMRSIDSIPIKAYAGVRPVFEDGDFHVVRSGRDERVIHLLGIESPGLTAAPAIARRVVSMLRDSGLSIKEKAGVRDVDPVIPAKELIRRGSAVEGGDEVICPCMGVTRLDVREAIRRGARTLDGVAFRTGLGMGICQGACLGRAIRVIAEELGVDPVKLTKKGGDSWLVTR
ncbi:glycerol-3-phosphate dehydrogenase [Thermocladium modestius]|uniref:Glycerol-3-phosphate dehydrogenase n=1 Tax=Thermocladium modestius TaxID=62609 RepID=A0A830GUG9_9CREN|nr:FAD-dependent oxidoreductase [Thermocladium modestius]GGP19765.1 glycerol-3-phosphate dehydrogenase [Thermocladium modestius]